MVTNVHFGGEYNSGPWRCSLHASFSLTSSPFKKDLSPNHFASICITKISLAIHPPLPYLSCTILYFTTNLIHQHRGTNKELKRGIESLCPLYNAIEANVILTVTYGGQVAARLLWPTIWYPITQLLH